jgi:large subunit ribosomal protein L37Ae
MGKTKKVRKAGRLGSRYGVGIRKRLLKIEDKQKKNYACPLCGFKKVKRKATGIFSCGKCHAKFAGGAYLPTTLPGTIIKKTVAQKSFASKGKGLEKMIEEQEEEKKEEKKPEKAKEKAEKAEKKAEKAKEKAEKAKEVA